MDKYELRRLRLQELIDHCCDGVAARLARRIEREPNYVSRMLYPAGKPQKKRIADDMIEILETRFDLPRAWFDMPLGSALPPRDPAVRVITGDAPPAPYVHPDPTIAAVVALMERATPQGRQNCLIAINAILALEPPGDSVFESRTGT